MEELGCLSLCVACEMLHYYKLNRHNTQTASVAQVM